MEEQQRQAALGGVPLPFDVLRKLFDAVNVALTEVGCDDSRRLTEAWLASHGHDLDRVLPWLDDNGGYCDCEVLMNVEPHVDDLAPPPLSS